MKNLPIQFPDILDIPVLKLTDFTPSVRRVIKAKINEQNYDVYQSLSSDVQQSQNTMTSQTLQHQTANTEIQTSVDGQNQFSHNQAQQLQFLFLLIPQQFYDQLNIGLPKPTESQIQFIERLNKKQVLVLLSNGAAFCCAMKKYDDQQHCSFINFHATKPTEKKLNFRKFLQVLMVFPTFENQINFHDVGNLILGEEILTFKLIQCIYKTLDNWHRRIGQMSEIFNLCKLNFEGVCYSTREIVLKSTPTRLNPKQLLMNQNSKKATVDVCQQIDDYIAQFEKSQFVDRVNNFISSQIAQLQLPSLQSDQWNNGVGLLLLLEKISNDDLKNIIKFQFDRFHNSVDKVARMLTFIQTPVTADLFLQENYYKFVVLMEVFGGIYIQKYGYDNFIKMIQSKIGNYSDVSQQAINLGQHQYSKQHVLNLLLYFFGIRSEIELERVMVNNDIYVKLLSLVGKYNKDKNLITTLRDYCTLRNIHLSNDVINKMENGRLDSYVYQFLSNFFDTLIHQRMSRQVLRVAGDSIIEDIAPQNLTKICQTSQLEQWMFEE